MNTLKTYVSPTSQPDSYLVYWTNNQLSPKGVIRVRLSAQIEDRAIAAELAAIQHLIEDKAVLGNTLIGCPSTKFIVCHGATRKLQRQQSDKVHLAPYAHFLTTRFAGCQISVDSDTRWLESYNPEAEAGAIEDLLVSGPRRETINITGIGQVTVTQHVLERFAERGLRKPRINGADQAKPTTKTNATAWKKLLELAADPTVREVTRHSLFAAANHSTPTKQEGRYFLNSHKRLILVVTDNPREGKRLVTTYPATAQFRDMPRAA
jgi:hypothetical protein